MVVEVSKSNCFTQKDEKSFNSWSDTQNNTEELKWIDSNDTLVCDHEAHKAVLSTHSHFFWMAWILIYAYSMHWFQKYTLL